MDETCQVARGNQQKFASRRNVHLVCEEMAFKLQLLNYGERFCVLRRCRPFSRLYFALGAGAVAGSEDSFSEMARPYAASGQAQFWTFIELVLWLLAVAEGRESEADGFDPRGQHELAVISEVIDRARRLGCSADFPPARLKTGCGDAVCMLLDDVAAVALQRGDRFKWRSHDAAKSDSDDMHQDEASMLEPEGSGDEAVMTDRSLDSVTGNASDQEVEWENGFGEGKGEGASEGGVTFSSMTPEQGLLWKKETARLSQSGALGTAKLALGKGGWRVSAIVLEKAVSRVAPNVAQAIPALEIVTEALTSELAELQHVEAQANAACAEQVQRLQVAQEAWKSLATRHEAASVGLAEKTRQMAEVQDDLRDAKNQYEEVSSGTHDAAPLRDIKKAVKTVLRETQEMDSRINWLREHLPSHRPGKPGAEQAEVESDE